MKEVRLLMQIGMIGLGKMGLNLVKNMIRNGNEVVAFDLNEDNVKLAQRAGATPEIGRAHV